MTIAQQLRQEGREEGREEGRQEGRQEDIIEALEIRFGEIPANLAEAIRTIHDESRLRELLRGAIKAATLDDFSRLL